MQLLSAQLGASPGKGGPAYAAQGAAFDGATWLSKTTDLTGAANGKQGTFSAWFKKDAAIDGANAVVLNGASGRITIFCQTDNTYRFQIRDTSALTRLSIDTVAAFTAASGWHHLLASWDMAVAGSGRIYVDDADDYAETTFSNTTLDYTGVNWIIGSNAVGSWSLGWHGDMADLYWNQGVYFDFDTPAERRKFITATGSPVDLGAAGQNPTGANPIIYHSGAVDAWHTNKGDGGGFTENGALTASPADP